MLETTQRRSNPFPWQPVAGVLSVVVLHLVLVAVNDGYGSDRLLRWGGLLRGRTWDEPWRLAVSCLLHIDVRHALGNGFSMMIFAVPLVADFGGVRASIIYVCAGLGGASMALQFADPGRLVVGSSGAVAGLFGAWLVVALRRAGRADLAARARFRVAGIGMLFLPSLLSPVNSVGQRISVSSHVGGLLTGMAIGALLSLTLAPHDENPDDLPGVDDERFRGDSGLGDPDRFGVN